MGKFILAILGTSLVVAAILCGSFIWDSFVISPKAEATAVTFQVEEGSSVKSISKQLRELDLIKSRFFFHTYVWLTGTEQQFQPGEFQLASGMNYRMLVRALTNAQAQEVELTIPEGFTLKQIFARVHELLPKIQEGDWNAVTGAQGALLVSNTHLLGGIPKNQSLEGYLFPDTYRFRNDADASVIVETMVLTLKRRLAEQDVSIPDDLVMSNGMTFHQVLTLASIVEREVTLPEDMRKIADIFLRRLKIGMALQADSTVNYVTGGNTPAISLEDREIDSPYNTYKRVGLPPGPISNPGMNAILAVLNPTANDSLYFLTTPDGTVIYSSSFDEHVKNKQWYLK